jgi:hypothetical protein
MVTVSFIDTTLKLLTVGENTTDHPQVTDHGEKYH